VEQGRAYEHVLAVTGLQRAVLDVFRARKIPKACARGEDVALEEEERTRRRRRWSARKAGRRIAFGT